MPRRKSDESSRSESVREWLERQIRNGTYGPGDRLDEQEICGRFEISRTPVREALLQLATLNLVTFRPRQGAVVTRLTVREIVGMWEVLTCLEGFCAGLAARRITEHELSELRSVHKNARSFVETDDTEGYANANQTFHESIYRACKNDYLSGQVRDIRSRLQAYRRYPFSRTGGLERSMAGHDAVVAALEKGDDVVASAAMHEHVASAMSFVDLIAEIP
ncbi:GntR family transcriptional regulator, partial [Enterovirga sp.]|uniref:GntR family transcriptional regulator n=1 Tax=Enterovirga sp. TaxID=2026350 RepID=UPI00261AF9EC